MPGRPFAREPFLETRYGRTGTRFLVFPQPRFIRGFARPVLIYVNAAPGTIRPGPQDDRIYVIDAKNKTPYASSGGHPPYTGRRWPQARPDPHGHFDDLKPDTDPDDSNEDVGFRSATTFATIRCVLDIWETYLGQRIAWHFRDTYPRLEVIPRVKTLNAWSRYGYVELGKGDPAGLVCENFDTVAHEVGHLILKAVIGNRPDPKFVEFRAHEEACADLVALVASLHFGSVVRRMFRQTQGRLYTPSVVSAIAESVTRRDAANRATMGNVTWFASPDECRYELSLPFLGAAFDLLAEIYEKALVERGAISQRLNRDSAAERSRPARQLKQAFARSLARHARAFTAALIEARDYFGRLLARTWQLTPLQDVSYSRIVANMIAADAELRSGHAALIRDSFARRGILPARAP